MSDPTPPLDEFLAAYDQNDNEWWYLEGGDHLNLFDEALDRMRAAEAAVARCRALHSGEHVCAKTLHTSAWHSDTNPCATIRALDGDA